MSLDDALRAPFRLLARRGGALLPLYLLAASAPGVARAPLFVALAVAVASLAATGRLDPVFEALREVDLRRLEAQSGAGAGSIDPAAAAALQEAVSALVTPLVVGLLGVGALLAVGVGVVASGVASAATLPAVDAGLRREDPLIAGVRGLGRHWRAFVWLAVGRALAYLALGGAALALVGGVAAVGGAAAVVAGVLALVVALPAVVAVELLVGIAGPAVVVDDVGATAALRRAARLALDRPGAYVVLLLAGGALLVGVGVAAGLATVAGVGRVVGLVTALVVAPLFDGLRVALYANREPADDAGDDPSDVLERRSPVARLLAVPRDGLVALGGFVRGHPAANAGGAALLGAGFTAGWALVAPYGLGVAPPGDVGNVFGAVPVGPFLNIAANNWLVAAGAAYGGVAAGVPTVVALGFNGALLGVVAGVTEPTAFLALVGPHATLELPAIAVAGGLGLHLGRVGVGAVRGRKSAAEVARALDETFRVLVGLGVTFVAAAGIEAFVTPAVAAAVLG
ncbi:MAG: stage II sporulation protein M [Haloferacaceae archaeon]